MACSTVYEQKSMNSMAHTKIDPALMQSCDSLPFNAAMDLRSIPDVTLTSEEFTSLRLRPVTEDHSFLLLDGEESLKVSSASKFASRLNSSENVKVKVVSIVGKTGDGKSHTLNQVFFKGEAVFKTSNEQRSCTMGVWAAFDPCLNVIVLDTEGLLGTTKEESKRTRLLIKILAVSDIVIYRTRAERLHSDMYSFLGAASWAFTEHFSSALSSLISRGGLGGKLSTLGPAVIIFHETRDTHPLSGTTNESVDEILRRNFAEHDTNPDAFSSLRYIGTQTKRPPTKFSELYNALRAELSNTCVRTPRQTDVVFQTLKVLNDKFSGKIVDPQCLPFPDHYFTCGAKCLACNKRCEASMGHLEDEQPHVSKASCCWQAQYNNIVYTCKACHNNGQQVIVTASEPSLLGLANYVWSGYRYNCPHCGEIYCSRKYWYGNESPENTAVRTEITHVWPGNSLHPSGTQNTAQKVLDGVSFISEAVASVGSQPTRYLSSRVADFIAPKYWRPNHEITHCHHCQREFLLVETKHHCRACGEGFCHECSKEKQLVPEKGWTYPVRVCKDCYKPNNTADTPVDPVDDQEVRVRKYGEVLVNTISAVFEYPKELIKESARPSYWVPDEKALNCSNCDKKFGPLLPLHHCRACGQAVCDRCSPNKKKVPSHNWDYAVRVCNNCLKAD